MTRRSGATSTANIATASAARKKAACDLEVAKDALSAATARHYRVRRQFERGEDGVTGADATRASTAVDQASENFKRRGDACAAARAEEARVYFRSLADQLADADELLAKAQADAVRAVNRAWDSVERVATYRKNVVTHIHGEVGRLGMVAIVDADGVTGPSGIDLSNLPFHLRVHDGVEATASLVARDGGEVTYGDAARVASDAVSAPYLERVERAAQAASSQG